MKRFIWISLMMLCNFSVSAQCNVSDSLIYVLVLYSIGDTTNTQYVFKHPTIPSEIWDDKAKSVINNEYFDHKDSSCIADQIKHPAVKKWDVNKLKGKSKVKLVNRSKNKECLYISLPVFSRDKGRVIIFISTWLSDRKFGSGARYAIVCELEEDGWTMEIIPIWIT